MKTSKTAAAKPFPANEPTTTATNRGPWTRAQNILTVAAYFRLAADKAAGPLPRGEQAARMRELSAAIAHCGPARGKPDMKMQNVSAILAALGRPELICAGFKPLANVQKDRNAADFDAALWAAIEAAAAARDAVASMRGEQ